MRGTVSWLGGCLCTAWIAACAAPGATSSTWGDGGAPAGDDEAGMSGDDASPGLGRHAEDGGAGSDDVSAACAAAGQTICTKTDQCSHFLFQLKEPDTTTCAARYALQCETQLRAPGSNSTATFVQACAEATAAGSCNDLFDGVLPGACLAEPPGQLANGAACGESTQCASLDCRKATASYRGVCATAAKSGGTARAPTALLACSAWATRSAARSSPRAPAAARTPTASSPSSARTAPRPPRRAGRGVHLERPDLRQHDRPGVRSHDVQVRIRRAGLGGRYVRRRERGALHVQRLRDLQVRLEHGGHWLVSCSCCRRRQLQRERGPGMRGAGVLQRGRMHDARPHHLQVGAQRS